MESETFSANFSQPNIVEYKDCKPYRMYFDDIDLGEVKSWRRAWVILVAYLYHNHHDTVIAGVSSSLDIWFETIDDVNSSKGQYIAIDKNTYLSINLTPCGAIKNIRDFLKTCEIETSRVTVQFLKDGNIEPPAWEPPPPRKIWDAPPKKRVRKPWKPQPMDIHIPSKFVSDEDRQAYAFNCWLRRRLLRDINYEIKNSGMYDDSDDKLRAKLQVDLKPGMTVIDNLANEIINCMEDISKRALDMGSFWNMTTPRAYNAARSSIYQHYAERFNNDESFARFDICGHYYLLFLKGIAKGSIRIFVHDT